MNQQKEQEGTETAENRFFDRSVHAVYFVASSLKGFIPHASFRQDSELTENVNGAVVDAHEETWHYQTLV